jgi:regulatory protein
MQKTAKKRERTVRIPTTEYLSNVALFYLGRYAASEASLRRVLTNKLRRAAMSHTEFSHDTEKQSSLRNDIETIIEKHRKTGILNDAAYASTKINSMRRQGRSRSYIRNKLGQKGIKSQHVAEGLEEIDGVDTDPSEAEMSAALAFVKRKRLGSFRKSNITAGKSAEDLRKKDFAALARAGFSFAIAQKALGKNNEDFE